MNSLARRHYLLILLTTTGCLEPLADPEPLAVDQVDQAATGKCPDFGCGINGPEIDGKWFHDLNLDGEPNDKGFALVGYLRKGNALYNLRVTNGKLSGSLYLGPVGSPLTISGTGLRDATLKLERFGTTRYTATIQSVATVAQYWAKHPDGVALPRVETYTIYVVADATGIGDYLCPLPRTVTAGPDPMPEHSALVFEGDRISATHKTVSILNDNRWFNLGCEGSAIAKLHLTGHSQAAVSVGLVTDKRERQTMLKSLVADYCGGGTPFTVGGQRLEWRSDDGMLGFFPWIPTRVEARWTPQGADCLDTPRITAHPTASSNAEFPPSQLEDLIEMECEANDRPRPPPCGTSSSGYHLSTFNIYPFTTYP
jgi:hypothetical protein